ncbi:peroxisomal succinyl-coenzyme A thioesterase isoform X1 [Dasypus novemcinctus]|uniref:peroxisomal succinyl-coenzyme A thioesterase isoform X1 n=1 Tax=Dasypus novemcinctus TaxID=9361 RepID=UPI00265E8C2F|nr:peroxisomal succinyl-coenzyme A thioesterase isoform X2 [Dasypus novemcinctus]
MAATVTVEPAGRSRWDQPVRITVRGLAPGQPVTLRASLRDEKGELFRAHARYCAEGAGELDLTRAPALGGSFSGLEPMGLFWALEPEKPFLRLVKRDVQTPFAVELEVLDGHDPEPQRLLCRTVHERDFLPPGVRREPVRAGRVRATLFVPPGCGPFPGIIDIFGVGGGLWEYRASLLAGHGFATLAVAYSDFEDLPTGYNDVHLDYFEEALCYMLQHPQVKGPGVGLLGFSLGADICLSMASFLKNITATVSINGSVFTGNRSIHYKQSSIPPLGCDLRRLKYCNLWWFETTYAPRKSCSSSQSFPEGMNLLCGGLFDEVATVETWPRVGFNPFIGVFHKWEEEREKKPLKQEDEINEIWKRRKKPVHAALCFAIWRGIKDH